MAFIAPVGEIYLINQIEWGKDYKHTKYFSNATDQFNYITDSSRLIGANRPSKTAQNYIKNALSGTIKIKGHQENYLGCSYLCWKNTAIDSPLPEAHTYNYAFVDDVRYVSNEVFEIDYTIDVFQTYLFQGGCRIKKALIERTHTQTDAVGEHIEAEPLTSDRYVYKNGSVSHFYSGDISGWSVLMYASKARSEGTNIKSQGMRCGLPQGVYCNVFDSSGTDDAFKVFSDWLNGLSAESFAEWIEKIVAVVAVPSEFIDSTSGGLADTEDWTDDVYITKYNTTIDGFTPYNKKLLTYPYNCHYISDGDGSAMEYAYEFFTSNSMRFIMALAIQPQPEFIVAPYGYKGFPELRPNYDFKCTIKNFPMVPFVADAYKQYIGSQGLSNSVNLLLNGLGGAITSGILTNGVGLIGGAMAGAMGKTYISQELEGRQAKMSADGAHISSNSAMLALGQKTFYDCQKCVCEKDAKKIDNFFSRYGYGINTVGTIYFTNPRFNQHYVKTSEMMIEGGAPASVIKTLCDAFNSGITFWRGTVGSYDGIWDIE